MANAATNTFQQFQAVGDREDIEDIIYNVDPTETPALNNAGRGKASAILHEWQTDSLQTASTTNQQVEGFDLASGGTDSVQATTRIGNQTQISEKSVTISGTQESVDKAGRKSELAYQLAKKGKELKRDMEAMFLANIGASAGNSTTARIAGSLLVQIKSNINKDAGGTAPVYTTQPTGTWTDGTQRTFTEAIAKDVIQKTWIAGGNPKTIMVGALGKQAVSAFSGIVELTSIQKQLAGYTIIGAADAYVSDFGTLAVVPNRFQRSSTAFFIDWDYVAVKYLRPFMQTPLATTGDAQKRLMLAEYTFELKNEKACGVAVDLTP